VPFGQPDIPKMPFALMRNMILFFIGISPIEVFLSFG
jgi:hypothetical protein